MTEVSEPVHVGRVSLADVPMSDFRRILPKMRESGKVEESSPIGQFQQRMQNLFTVENGVEGESTTNRGLHVIWHRDGDMSFDVRDILNKDGILPFMYDALVKVHQQIPEINTVADLMSRIGEIDLKPDYKHLSLGDFFIAAMQPLRPNVQTDTTVHELNASPQTNGTITDDHATVNQLEWGRFAEKLRREGISPVQMSEIDWNNLIDELGLLEDKVISHLHLDGNMFPPEPHGPREAIQGEPQLIKKSSPSDRTEKFRQMTQQLENAGFEIVDDDDYEQSDKKNIYPESGDGKEDVRNRQIEQQQDYWTILKVKKKGDSKTHYIMENIIPSRESATFVLREEIIDVWTQLLGKRPDWQDFPLLSRRMGHLAGMRRIDHRIHWATNIKDYLESSSEDAVIFYLASYGGVFDQFTNFDESLNPRCSLLEEPYQTGLRGFYDSLGPEDLQKYEAWMKELYSFTYPTHSNNVNRMADHRIETPRYFAQLLSNFSVGGAKPQSTAGEST